MESVHRQLKETIEKFRTLEKVKAYHAELNDRLVKENNNLTRLEKQLKKEERDVKRLERTGVTGMFHKILGDREKQLEKERQEYLHVALKYNELIKSVELVQFELNVLSKKLNDYDLVREKYESLLKAREKELLALGGATGSQLMSLSEQIDQKHILLQDIDEAIVAGRDAYKYITTMEKRLKEARDWGQWDMYGGDNGSGWMKHHAVDRAREVLHKARHSLIRFDKELRDVYADKYLDLNVGVEDIDRFLDIFLDNIIVDWVVQRKIKRALRNVQKIRAEIGSAMKRLKADIPVTKLEIEDLTRRREEIIVQSAG